MSAFDLAASLSTRPSHTVCTKGSMARMRGGLSTDCRILRIWVCPGGFDSPSCISSGARVSSSRARKGACLNVAVSRLVATTSSWRAR